MSKKQLSHIRELIKQKQYDEARKQLQHLSDLGDPTAQKWLVKLNEIAPVKRTQTTYTPDRLDEIREQKKVQRKVEQREKTQRRTLGCLLRGCSTMIILGIIVFLMLPMLFAAAITSDNPRARRATTQVFTFVEEQQENPVGRAVTTMYTQTSGRAMKGVITPRTDQICDIALEQAAANGREATREECEQVLQEAMTCVTDEFDQAEQCLRRYLYNRCIQQVGNTAQGQTYCRNFVQQHMGP